jgi:hypothetical protein
MNGNCTDQACLWSSAGWILNPLTNLRKGTPTVTTMTDDHIQAWILPCSLQILLYDNQIFQTEIAKTCREIKPCCCTLLLPLPCYIIMPHSYLVKPPWRIYSFMVAEYTWTKIKLCQQLNNEGETVFNKLSLPFYSEVHKSQRIDESKWRPGNAQILYCANQLTT